MATKFVMRFYGQTEELIAECINQISPLANGLVSVTNRPLTQSVNPFLPKGINTEVVLTFKNKKFANEFHNNQKTRDIYQKYAVPGIKTEFKAITPNMTTFHMTTFLKVN